MHFFFIIEIQKAKDDAEEAYNSISEVAKKEVNKMIYKSLLMILDIWNSYMKKWKNSGPYGIWTWYRCSALPTELTSQLGAGQCVGSKETIQVMNDNFRYMKFI